MMNSQLNSGVISTTPQIDSLLAYGSPVAIGVSGGKDSSAVAAATLDHLDRIGHCGPRVLIHIAPQLLSWNTRSAIDSAKRAAKVRQEAERIIPKHLLYTKGWPTCVPSEGESRMLAEVRRRVAEAVGLDVNFADAESLQERYRALYVAKHGSIAA